MKKLICLMLATTMLVALAACAKGDDSSTVTANTGVPAPSSEAPVPVNHETGAYLTGLQKGADYPEGERITAVMVNNIAQARPLSGLSEADILVEIKVEGGITRFMAMYDDYKTIPRVGPVRSARDQFFQLLVPSQGFYVHIGESVEQTKYRESENYNDFDINGDYDGNMVMWDAERRAQGYAQEHTAYTDGEHIAQHIQDYGMDDRRTYTGTYLNFSPFDEPPRIPKDGPANSVPVIHSASYRTLFDYDAAANQYLMSQYNSNNGNIEPTVDADNDKQLAFDNLLILFTDIHTYPGHEAKDLQRVEYGQGAGFYVSQGHYEFVLWKKGGPLEALQIISTDKTETPLTINPGTSYIAMVSDTEWDNFYESITAGTGQQVAADGEQADNEAAYDT